MTTDTKAAIRALIEKVEAGDVRPPDFIGLAMQIFPKSHSAALRAYDGHFNPVRALLLAILRAMEAEAE